MTTGMVLVAPFAANGVVPLKGHNQISLKTNQVRRKLRQALILLLGEPILYGEILSFNPSKLAQLLPERVQEDCDTGSSAIIQETYAGDFPCLLRLSQSPTEDKCENDSQDPHPFSILDTSTWLPSTGSGPEFIEGSTGFRSFDFAQDRF
jgi:hypothetical protein